MMKIQEVQKELEDDKEDKKEESFSKDLEQTWYERSPM